MARCVRCWLQKSIRIVNVIINLLVIGMIIYALWLLKKWNEGVAEFPTFAYFPKPWFIYTCLGVGIAVCLSTLFGYIVTNSISNSALLIYIGTICSLVSLEVAAVVAVFFVKDWLKVISMYIDEGHTKFKIFVVLNLKMCKLIAIVILVPQIHVIVLAVTLLAIGINPRIHRSNSEIIQSFLVGPNSPMPHESIDTCSSCENLLEENPHENFWSFTKSLLRVWFCRTVNLL